MSVVIFLSCLLVCVQADYIKDRNQMISNEESRAVGSNLILTDKEEQVNKHLMEAKVAELEAGFEAPGSFPPAEHFFEARQAIDKSEVFSFIQQMPKGGVLHMHDTSSSSVDYLVANITYRNNLYACVVNGTITTFVFAKPKPEGYCWQLLKTMREESQNVTNFDAMLRKMFSLETEKPEEVYPDIVVVWKAFTHMFDVVESFLLFQPAFLDYFRNILEEFYNDGVKYLEYRTSFPELYNLDGSTRSPLEVLQFLKSVVKDFQQSHSDFVGVRFIYSTGRHVNNLTLEKDLAVMEQLHNKFPEDVIGFDLVGPEDYGYPLIDFINILQNISGHYHFFFHAGETDWNGMSTDLNLFDAILLNTTRIGHAYAALKHPVILEKIKQRNIAIELNPISNQVLMLVKDLRNHPGSFLLAEDYPVVIAPDDPGFWSARGVSYDYYEVFMGLASKEADLKMLKQLAFNSLHYSALPFSAKMYAIKNWESDWDNFIDAILLSYNNK